MTRETFSAFPAIIDLLSTEDVLVAELDDIWKNAPKFPDVGASAERIDVNSFIQIYRDIDDIFEDDYAGDTGALALKNGLSQESKDDGSSAIEEGDVEAKDEQGVGTDVQNYMR